MSLLRAEHISFQYGTRPILENVSLAVDQGEVLSLLGPNGSGKTTLLKILLGILHPAQGTVHIHERPLASYTQAALAKAIAYVPQMHRLAFSYRVDEVALMGRTAHHGVFGRASAHDRRIVTEALERLNIAHLASARYSEISGGERQLTLLARALTQGARILILDEPLNGLDYGNQIHVLEQIAGLAKEGYTCVKTTHFPDHALWMASRVILLRQGRIVDKGKPSIVITAQSLSELYHADIAVCDIAEGVQSCIPLSTLQYGIIKKKKIYIHYR